MEEITNQFHSFDINIKKIVYLVKISILLNMITHIVINYV